MTVYVTLNSLRRTLGLAAAQTGDDDLLLALIGAASRLIEGYTARRFYPARQTRRYAWGDPARLLLDGDLLALHTLTNGDGSVIPSSAYHLLPSSVSVKSSLLLDPAQAVFNYDSDPVEAIAVDGTWGYHPDWAAAWEASGDSVQNNPLSASATSISVQDADGPGANGYPPRFAVGQLLAIEDEYLHVTAVNTTSNTLTVARGANGTPAAIHAQGTAIKVYQPPEDVRQVCLRVAAWLYKQKDAGFVQTLGALRGQVSVPPALPDDVQQILAPYVRVQVA